MITIIFGEVGTGKTYLGQNLSMETGVKFVEGDDFIPNRLLRKMQHSVLTVRDIDEFIAEGLIPAIEKQYKKTNTMIVSQALYLKRHRDLISSTFGEKNVRFVWLPVKSIFTQLSRLWARIKGFRWIWIFFASKPWFEKPEQSAVFKINNEGDICTLREQLLIDKANSEIM